MREMWGPLVGRQADLEALAEHLSAKALVTVVGPGGMGKTRLARACMTQHEGPALYAPLDTCEGPEEIAAAVAVALSAGGGSVPADPVGVGVALLSRGPLLLVLDNFDTLVAHGPETVGRWLAQAPSLRCLITSRSPLGLAGEQIYTLGPLAVASATDLFITRASARCPGFDGAPERGVIDALVGALDGIPLAIELAAALVDLLTPAQILQRLGQRLSLLESDRRDQAARHRTLRAAIEGSVQRLTPDEAIVMAWCSVFHGGFTVAGAEALMAHHPDYGGLVIRAARGLKSVSLLHGEGGAGRLRFYDTIRAYAEEMLRDTGDLAAATAAHRAVYADADVVLGGLPPDHPEAAGRIAEESPNLLAVLADASAPLPGRLSAARLLARLYLARGPLDQVALVMAHLPALRAAGREHPQALAELLCLCARQHIITGGEAPGELLDEAEALLTAGAEEISGGAWRGLWVHWRWQRASAARAREALEEAERLYREALEEAEAHGEALATLRAQVLAHFAGLMFERGQVRAAREAFDEALLEVRRAGDLAAEGEMRTNRALVVQADGDLPEAWTDLEAALAIHRQLGRARYEGITLGDLAGVAFEAGWWADAPPRYQEAVEALGSAGDHLHQALYGAAGRACEALLGNLEVPPRASGGLQPAFAQAIGVYDQAAPVAAALGRWARGEPGLSESAEALAEALEAAAPACARSDEVRLACRVMGGVLADLERHEEAVGVVRGGEALRGPGKRWQDLTSRPVLARVLWALVRARRARVGGLTRAALIEAGWPGERMGADAATNRVHVALSTLRRLGLKGILGQVDGRYRLDPEVPLLIAP